MEPDEIEAAITALQADITALREESGQYLTRKNALSDVDQGFAFQNLGLTRIVHESPDAYIRATDVQALFENQTAILMAVRDTVLNEIAVIRTDVNSNTAQFSARTASVEDKLATALSYQPNPLPVPPLPSFNVTNLNALVMWVESVQPILDTIRKALLHAGLINEQR